MTNGRAITCPICRLPESNGTHQHYMVYDMVTLERGRFATAHDVAMFMWGRDFSRYQIYKFGVLFPWLDGDLRRFEQALEAV